MKRILVTGSRSYLGNAFARYMSRWPEVYQVDRVGTSDGSWREKDFSGYDAVYCVAGIAHVKETPENAHLYQKVNCDLAAALAEKSKAAGVRQFLYLSSMSVYGLTTGLITPETRPSPNTAYGRSKLAAEERLTALEDASFAVAILRPPMVYGKDCKGNFQTVLKLVKKLPLFPMCENSRSMLYVDHLNAFVKLLVDQELGGLFFPQNRDYVQTSRMATLMAETLGKPLRLSGLMGLGVRMLCPLTPVARKAFGSLVYQGTERFDFCYCTIPFEDTVRMSV